MRIDLVITELNVGGAERALTELAIGLDGLGDQVRVLSIGSPPAGGRAGLVEQLAEAGITTEFGGFDRWSQAWSALTWLKQRIRADPPDLCQTFLFHANCLGCLAARRAGVGRVIGGLRVAESKRLRCLLERQAIARMDRLVCVSSRVAAFAKDRLAAGNKTSVIPNGVDVARFQNVDPIDWAEIGWPSDARVILFIGRFHPQKGLEQLQRKAEEILAADPRRRILLIGDGPLRDELEGWSRTDSAIRVLPWQADVRRYLRGSRVLVLPSHYEGMPNVVLEAMAAGRPVVSSLVEGSEELLGTEMAERRAAQGFTPGNADEMATRLGDILRDDELARRLGEQNLDFVRDRFSIGEMVNAYRHLYAESLGAASA